MYDPDADAPPFNPLPPVVVLLVILIGAVELMFQLGENGILGGPAGRGWRGAIAQQFGFPNAVVFWMWDTAQYPLQHLIRFISYMFVHNTFMAAVFSIVFVLALGKFVGERVSALVFLVIFFGAGIVAALLQAIVMGPNAAMLGAGAACYGLIGALSWILFTDQRAVGENGLRAFSLIGGLAVIHLVFFLVFGGHDWFERLVGFGVGFVLCMILRPAQGQSILYWRNYFRRS